MRFLKDNILRMSEYFLTPDSLFSVLGTVSYGSSIYQLSTEELEELKNMKTLDRVSELTSVEGSRFTARRIGLFNPNLPGSPLILSHKEDGFVRSFVFILKNSQYNITHNDCEVVDNYPNIFDTRDISKYNIDHALFTDEDISSFIKSMMDICTRFYHVEKSGFLLRETPEDKEKEEKIKAYITHGKTTPRRTKITKKQTLQFLDEFIRENQEPSIDM